ncbi:MAG: PAS domain-containing protein [Streptococcaceae bacterium]|jgi:two-component system sensor histidine kinase VicK|nr:PAS domain-containing protein [Streptococcaceae bacterium]
MRPRQAQTLLLKVVGFHLLLFAVFFIIVVIIPTHLAMLQIFFLVFLLSLIVTSYFALDVARNIRILSHDVDRITHGDYSVTSDYTQSRELDELSRKVARLGQVIKSSQDNLENQHNQLNGILAYMTDGVIATDRSGIVTLANTAALHLLNTTTRDILKKNIAEALSIDNYYAFRDLLDQTPELKIDAENSYGEYVRLKVSFSIFRREEGMISGIVAVLHDATDAERAERERRLFVSNVSHELRTPLTTVKSYLETLQDGAMHDMDIAPGFVETSLTETNHMIRMISDLLELSRIDQGRLKLNKEVVNLVAFLTHQIARFEQVQANNEKIKFVSKLPLSPVWVEIDPERFSQVIDNLLSNAIKYSPDGGTITIRLKTEKKQVVLSIKDEGIGIPTADLPKIFDRFYRVDKARTHDAGGTGLGLAIVYDIVKMHGGYIWAKSTGENEGSEFTVILPYTEIDYTDENWESESEIGNEIESNRND